jgi:hypothetical protein
MNNNTLVAIALIALAIVSFKLHCTNNEVKQRDNYINELQNENAEIAADRMLALDTVDVLKKKLNQSETEKQEAILNYQAATRATKNAMLKHFGKVTIKHDTIQIACLDSNAVDSVNRLAIAYDFCAKDGKTKDTIITHLTNANLQADTLLTNKDKVITAVKEDAKFEKTARKFWQGLAIGVGAFQAVIVYIAVTAK